MTEAIESMRAVTIAAVHGYCVGGGLVLALACDLRLAAASTTFAIPEVDLGIPLSWGAIPRLMREIGPTATRDLVLSCRRFDADEALRSGLLSRIVDDDAVHDEADALAASLAAKAPFAVRATLDAVAAAAEAAVPSGGCWSDADALATAFHDPECQAAAARYLERRTR
jgi:enoyl-CoA hydratase/carnithine racemase